MSAVPNASGKMTESEYLAFERDSEFKHEFLNGELVAMSGASAEHNTISGNTFALLWQQRRGGPCRVYGSDMCVRISHTHYTYPDISVVCGEPQIVHDGIDALLNPTLIIEVLSPSTERYDRGKKFQSYRELESLQEYVLIAQDSPHIERYVRQEHGFWQFSDVAGLAGHIELASINCALALAEVYEQVTFLTEGDES